MALPTSNNNITTKFETKLALLNTKLSSLMDALQDHLQMNLESPTSASKTLHFVWDFVQRTRHNLSFVSAQDLAANKRAALEPYNDSRGRAMFSAMIIRDRTGQTCRKMGMEPVDFGDAVREKAAALESET